MTQAQGSDPQRIIDDAPMNWRQYVVVLLMVLLNALDGFDVLSSAFASPGISKEWGVPREALGIMLSAELLEEMLEADLAYRDGDYSQCLRELSHCGAVVLRTMLMVIVKMSSGKKRRDQYAS